MRKSVPLSSGFCITEFAASVFWVRRLATLGGEQSMVEYWQTKRGGGLRGVIEIVEVRDD